MITLWLLPVAQKGFVSLAAAESRMSRVLRSDCCLQQQVDIHTVRSRTHYVNPPESAALYSIKLYCRLQRPTRHTITYST